MAGGDTVDINLTSQAGIFSWNVEGINVLQQQWYWYRLGSTGPERSIDSMTFVNRQLYGTNRVVSNYTDVAVGLALTLDISLFSMGPTATLQQSLNWTNNNEAPLTLNVFAYSHFLFGGTNQVSYLPAAKTFYQNGTSGEVYITATFPSTVVGREANLYSNTLTSLNDGVATDLPSSGMETASGDVTSAFQWRQTVAPGSSFLMGINEDVAMTGEVPEPGSLVLILGGGALIFAGKRRAGNRPAWRR